MYIHDAYAKKLLFLFYNATIYKSTVDLFALGFMRDLCFRVTRVLSSLFII